MVWEGDNGDDVRQDIVGGGVEEREVRCCCLHLLGDSVCIRGSAKLWPLEENI